MHRRCRHRARPEAPSLAQKYPCQLSVSVFFGAEGGRVVGQTLLRGAHAAAVHIAGSNPRTSCGAGHHPREHLNRLLVGAAVATARRVHPMAKPRQPPRLRPLAAALRGALSDDDAARCSLAAKSSGRAVSHDVASGRG